MLEYHSTILSSLQPTTFTADVMQGGGVMPLGGVEETGKTAIVLLLATNSLDQVWGHPIPAWVWSHSAGLD